MEKYNEKNLSNVSKKFYGIPWNYETDVDGIPWNFMEFSMKFHGIFVN
jgi:hypothetical protein